MEADGRVKLHTIEEFFGKNIKKAEIFTRRVTNKRVRIDYSRYLGKKYDNQFSLNNDAYYCSELVYVIYLHYLIKQLGMELCTPRPLCRHNVFGLKWLLRKRGIDVNQLVVTPADLFKDYLK